LWDDHFSKQWEMQKLRDEAKHQRLDEQRASRRSGSNGRGSFQEDSHTERQDDEVGPVPISKAGERQNRGLASPPGDEVVDEMSPSLFLDDGGNAEEQIQQNSQLGQKKTKQLQLRIRQLEQAVMF
jgi:hypothetical protein